MRLEFVGDGQIPRLVLSRRNLLTLLAKLDGYPENSKCQIERGGMIVMAEEDHVHYMNRPAGRMHPATEDQIPKPETGTKWA